MADSTSARPIYGYTTVPSTSRTVAFIAATPGEGQAPVSIVGKLVYFDVRVDNQLYRSIGTVTNMTTYNTGLNSTYEGVIAERSASEGAVPLFSADLRKSEVAIQAVFKRGPQGWEQYNSVLPTSPDSNRPVHIVSEDTIGEMLQNSEYPSIGFFRGLHSPVPFNVPNFDKSATHESVLGKSGSGKALALDTKVPTPRGWTTMGALQDGDEVFDERGEVTRVVKAHPVITDAKCYEVIFSDGSKLTADARHLWYTETHYSRDIYANVERFNLQKAGKTLFSPETISSLRWLEGEATEKSTITAAELKAVLQIESKKFNSSTASLLAMVRTEMPQLPKGHYPAQTVLRELAILGSKTISPRSGEKGSVKTTEEIKNSLRTASAKPIFNHSVPLAAAVNYCEKELPLDPYTFGAWLGDGISSRGIICGIDDELFVEISKSGLEILSTRKDVRTKNKNYRLVTYRGLRTILRRMGVLQTDVGESKKFIPAVFLQGSVAQRRALLAGIMDTDGYVTKNSSVGITLSNEALASDVRELVASLGYRVVLRKRHAPRTKTGQPFLYSMTWTTSDKIFNLTRKRQQHEGMRATDAGHRTDRRYITAVNEVDSVPVRCITVDSPSALFLVGESFIPTHNTQVYSMVLAAAMRHEDHAIMVIDPQGQWSNENGFIFSLQNFAESLGREVDILRVAEDIQLPLNSDAITKMIEKIGVWRRFRRMGSDQVEAFSREVAERFAQRWESINRGATTRQLLEKIFSEIASSPSSLSRIYVPGERQDRFRDELKLLTGEEIINDDGESRIITAEEEADAEDNWASILYGFEPLHNLFAPKNLSGTRRRPLGGAKGFLTNIFQVRNKDSNPAPYVVLDMSPNVGLHAKADLLGRDANSGMQKLLDNQDMKALILIMVMEEMKRASETAFASGTGLLNTRIVFDEAWRYAPEGRATPEIEELANMLEGFALDTRKFGIGWTYILQSPSDLKMGIRRQLTYVYAGYGLVGDDVRQLESMTDDPKQVDLYRQFISPFSTKQYPFMVLGPISPLIFTTAPTFLNAFNGNEEFLEHNMGWIREITHRRSLPSITIESLAKSVLKPLAKATVTAKEHKVGRTYSVSEPQVAPKPLANANEGRRLLAEVKRPITTSEPVGNDEPLGEAPF